jgi:hypothetical protein
LLRRGRNDRRSRKGERATDERDRYHRHHQGARRPHRPTEHLSWQVGQPRPAFLAPLAVCQDGGEDPGIEIGRRRGLRQRAQELHQPGAATQLGCACRTVANMLRKLSRAGLIELVEKVGVDQPAGGMVGPVRPLKATHTLYKAREHGKVAGILQGSFQVARRRARLARPSDQPRMAFSLATGSPKRARRGSA